MRLIVIADELTSVGWRLAGAEVLIPSDAQAVQACLQAAAGADLALITAELAARLPAPLRSQALQELRPLLLVIPDLLHRQEPADIEGEVRRALGVAI